ncbi:OpgC domain-containing protein [Rhodobacter sp. HX-7-19]|uniref:OpgC domain-containing protein n=1 Tax=Paragemmobacter kunshanensis TaxID=2583234 RepID=A0A6M1U3V8_9RHOB|nr:OpgC domain-containing protein [Rhodobacter kunshanensis]NGQ92274.1 OpgC domain-containing protein [Rhodobacter kunshanensis]
MPAPSPAPAAPLKTRDPRLDVFRGLCLVMIFINHVPGNIYEGATSRNFGFSDAAEGFVLMSGIAAGLAYSADFREASMRLWTGLARVWRRVWTLYLVHILATFAALAAAAAVALWLGNAESLFENQMKWVWLDPLRTLIGLVILTHQFGYVNILPLYLVLLAFAPILLFLAWRWPLWLLAGSVALWLVAGIWRLGPPNYPTSGVWFFNPLTWQVIFVTGLVTGVALKEGRRLVPVRRWLQVATGLFLLYAALSVQIPAVSKLTGNSLWLLRETFNLPWNLTAFDKTYVTGPRLLHILALAYFLSSFPAVRRACAHPLAAPFELLGRQALPVFALGSVLCIGLQGVKHVTGEDILADSLILAGGLAAQFALAAARQYWPKPPKIS